MQQDLKAKTEGRKERREKPSHGALLLVLLAMGLGLFGVFRLLRAPEPGPAKPVTAFEVPAGSTARSISLRLHEKGLIRDERAFRALIVATGSAKKLRAGEFPLSPSMSAREVLDALLRGPPVLHEVLVPEGFTARQIAARLEALGIGSAARYKELAFSKSFTASLGVQADSLEGYLFPTTYSFSKPFSEEKVLSDMVGSLRKALPMGWEAGARRQGLKSLHELLTLASIVEKETGQGFERPLIAGLFLNRLKKGMRLQTDPTVIYGIGETYDGNIRKKDLLKPTPYNTYVIKGLPPGPIASPGLAAIQAVLSPQPSGYLFFVARKDGTHHFSETYGEHEQAVRYYQLGRGKPPRQTSAKR
ncbi:MAG: endolytic transglycosylase MltG [Bdellovibrionota bacterium]